MAERPDEPARSTNGFRLAGGLIAAMLVVGLVGWWFRHPTGSAAIPAWRPNGELRQPDSQFFAPALKSNKLALSSRTSLESEGSQPGTRLDRTGQRSISSGSLTKNEQVTKRINEGVRLMTAGQLEEAIGQFQRVLELDPRCEDAYFNLGIAYGRQGKVDEAVRHYEQALEIMPDYAEAHNNLGNLMASQGRLEEAIRHFSTALAILPNYASAQNNYGTALARMGQTEEAATHFREAIRLTPDYAEAHFNLANVLLRLNQTDAAIQEYKATLRLKPGFEPAQKALAKVQFGKDSDKDAATH